VLTCHYTWRITLLLALTVSGIILSLQFPIIIYSPDISFHTAKILRASHSDFFIDPFIGISSIYPSLFHFCFGILKRFLGLDSVQIIRLIMLVDFIGIFAAFFYCANAFFDNTEETSLCVLSLPLVFYAPTGRYLLMPQPSSFSFVFLIFGIGALYRYLMYPRIIYLILGGLFLSFAVNIWWINVFSVFPIFLLLFYYTIRQKSIPELSHAFIFIFSLLIPCFYTVWHFYNIWDILPHYFAETSKKINILHSISEVITSFFTKGNLQFIHHFYFWDLSKGPLASAFLPDRVKLLYSLVSIFHYFFLVLPFNLLLVSYVCWILSRKDKLVMHSNSLLRTLPIGGLFILICSIGTYADQGKLRRVHFIIYVMFLLFAYKTLPFVIRAEKLRKISTYVCIASLLAIGYTVVYSPRLFTSSIPDTDNEIIRFISSMPNHESERVELCLLLHLKVLSREIINIIIKTQLPR
jgi:hypothetical protein